MNEWVKRKWLRALKSGEYGKGSGALEKMYSDGSRTYCCLGVLAEEMVPEFCNEGNYKMSVDGDFGYLPDDLAILWELDNNAQTKLAALNDQSSTFDRVITYIENNL